MVASWEVPLVRVLCMGHAHLRTLNPPFKQYSGAPRATLVWCASAVKHCSIFSNPQFTRLFFFGVRLRLLLYWTCDPDLTQASLTPNCARASHA
eukprot:3414646-Amphidinium_carterae.1